MNCFCEQEFTKNKLKEHKQNCLAFVKNNLKVKKLKIATFSANLYSNYNRKVSSTRFNTEFEYLFDKLRQSFPERTRL
jgi:hypothetical protein